MKIATFLLPLVFAMPAIAVASDADTTTPLTSLAPRPVLSEIVNAQSGERTYFVGTVVARAETDLGFPMNGTIAERPAETGDLVSRGDVLALVDPEDLEADVRAAEAGVSVTTAQLRAARDNENRARELLQRGVDSATRLEDAARGLTSAEAQLEQALATLRRAEDMRSLATLTAPQDGVITQVYHEAGASLTAGQPVVRLAGTSNREIIIDMSEHSVAGLKNGTVFEATLAANNSVTAQATLTRIDQVAASATRTRRAHLTMAAPPVGFRLGALVRVSPAANAEIGVSLNRSAIVDPEGTPAVWIVDRNTNAVHLKPVTLGGTFGSRVRITDGVGEGDEVIIKGINSLEDGQIVGPRVTK
ncbi:efflux RND transporter periplasmic adaptor subunit [Lentibacter algarum]|uniref:efflux RND transporter periplasmic adaptor subunit n=1 Tax=Lentibacter algarum TaxID=576131 RepID=UPI001C068C18|nr:efflux RND transporter periplasmic adaptor subunit [Lentibacter algarum]MBU2980411.1 efflux RND transporter periplasmic adaptor subunit [Lentibacter algarum]